MTNRRPFLLAAALASTVLACPESIIDGGYDFVRGSGAAPGSSVASSSGTPASSSAGTGGDAGTDADAGTGGGDGGLQCGQGGSGVTVWSRRYGDSNSQLATAVAVDASGNIVVAGGYAGSVDFGCGAPDAGPGSSFFVTKLDPAGACLWSESFPAGPGTAVPGAAIDPSGNVVVTGSFQGSIAFAGNTLTSTGGSAFVAKLSPNGVPIWGEALGENGGGVGIAADASGDVIIVGVFEGTTHFGGAMLTSASGGSAFVAMLDPNGNPMWAQSSGLGGPAGADRVAVDPSGNIFVTGAYGPSPANFGCGALPPATAINPYVVKMSSNDGTCSWSKAFSSAGPAYGTGIAVTPSGNVAVTGYFAGPGGIDLGAGHFVAASGKTNTLVARLDPTGTCTWGRGFGTSGETFAKALAVDGESAVFIAGYLTGSADFGNTTLTSPGGKSLFVASLDTSADAGDGTRWARSFDNSQAFPGGIAVDPADHLVVAGGFTGSIDFGCGPLMSAGSADVFVAELVR